MKKLIFLFVGTLFIAGVFSFGAPQVKALTTDELISQIGIIQRQIDALRTQLRSIKTPAPEPTPIPGPIPTPTPAPAPPDGGGGGGFEVPIPLPIPVPDPWCHIFTQNLRFGMSGSEVTALQTALAKDGSKRWEYKGFDGVFDEMTASEVVGFQQKYASEILTPLGLQYGTGFVGKSTRTKLDSLYGCGRITPTPIPTPIPGPVPIIPTPISPPSSTAGSLSLSVASDTPRSQTIAKGSTSIELLRYNISAGPAEDVKITELTVQLAEFENGLYSQFPEGSVTNVRLYDGSVLLGIVSSASFWTEFPSLNLIIPKSTTKTLKVAVDIPLASTITSLVAAIPTEVGNYGVTAYGAVSGQQLTSLAGQITLTGSGRGSVMAIITPLPGPIPISAPSIIVLSPNGGEQLVRGETYQIRWKSVGVDWVSLYLFDYQNGSVHVVQWIEKQLSASKGIYSWRIPDWLTIVGDKYKIGVEYSKTINDESDNYFSIVSSSTQPPISYAAPEMVYPANGQVLNYGYPYAYMFKVKPVAGASGYLFGFFQNGTMVYENLRDDKKLSTNGEFAIWPENPFYSKLQEGNLEVWIRASINNQWSEARIITVKLVSKTIAACTDSDGGKDYYAAGTTTGRDSYGGNLNRMATYQDKSDANNTRVLEFYCENINDSTGLGYVVMENFPCPYGSANGACLRQANTQ